MDLADKSAKPAPTPGDRSATDFVGTEVKLDPPNHKKYRRGTGVGLLQQFFRRVVCCSILRNHGCIGLPNFERHALDLIVVLLRLGLECSPGLDV